MVERPLQSLQRMTVVCAHKLGVGGKHREEGTENAEFHEGVFSTWKRMMFRSLNGSDG